MNIREAYEDYYQRRPQADRKAGQLNIRRTIKRLSNIKGLKQSSGICQVAYDQHTHRPVLLIHALIRVAFSTWPEFSGSLGYPVQSTWEPTKGEHGAQYALTSRLCTMYDARTEYGKARRRLAKHVISELKTLLED